MVVQIILLDLRNFTSYVLFHALWRSPDLLNWRIKPVTCFTFQFHSISTAPKLNRSGPIAFVCDRLNSAFLGIVLSTSWWASLMRCTRGDTDSVGGSGMTALRIIASLFSRVVVLFLSVSSSIEIVEHEHRFVYFRAVPQLSLYSIT